eukprot:scaffold368_cov258-Pinguiococcus_pyrenoidosus.AAC.33
MEISDDTQMLEQTPQVYRSMYGKTQTAHHRSRRCVAATKFLYAAFPCAPRCFQERFVWHAKARVERRWALVEKWRRQPSPHSESPRQVLPAGLRFCSADTNPQVFFDMSIGGEAAGRIVFELRAGGLL